MKKNITLSHFAAANHACAAFKSAPLALAIALVLAGGAYAAEPFPAEQSPAEQSPAAENEKRQLEQSQQPVDEVIVFGVQTKSALTVSTDPKLPRQPLPAHDGADYLKTIPGFSMIRKGGADGDPVFRGMAGSRLNISIGGEMVLGGCSNRMDPPTAYVFPEAYDEIKVIKGPQTVLYGAGNSAGVVLFNRDNVQPEAGWSGHVSGLTGSFGRTDMSADVVGAGDLFYARASATVTEQDNYTDGDGVEVHSQYERWSTQLALGWTPNDDTTIELTGSRSDGEAAYADRGVDGSKFARDNVGLKATLTNLSETLTRVEANVYYNYVDHVMDNYTLRNPAPSGMMAMPMAMNPDRQTNGARVASDWQLGVRSVIKLGADYQSNAHSNRSTMNQLATPYENLDRVDDSEFNQTGLFAEWHLDVADAQQRVITGLRADRWQGKDLRENVAVSMMMSMPNPTANQERAETLYSGFARYEKDFSLSMPATFYLGLGHTERFPDYWELISKETETSISAFDTDTEKTTQLDVGVLLKSKNVVGSVSAFYNTISDYIMIQSGVIKPAGMMGTRTTSIARNIDARTWGLEADAKYLFTDHWNISATLASVRGSNDTDNKTLPQLPPIEMRLGLNYEGDTWEFGTMLRAVDAQERVDINSGNIVGQDFGETAGFGVLSLNAGWRPSDGIHVTAGLDNLFNKTYAEHVSRASASISGFEQTTRVNEPGRTAWLKAQFDF